MPRQYLPQSDGRVYFQRPCEKARRGGSLFSRFFRYKHGRNLERNAMASVRCSCKRVTTANTICSFECKRRVITSKHIKRACDCFGSNVGHQNLRRRKQRKAPPKRGKKLSFFDWNPKLAISLITLISPVPMCYHKLRSIFQLIS